MPSLLSLYEARLHGVSMSTTEELESLLMNDEKTFYFALMYFYLTSRDLEFIIRKSALLGNMVSLFCMGCQDPRISSYYSTYVDLNETFIQIQKIHLELEREGYS